MFGHNDGSIACCDVRDLGVLQEEFDCVRVAFAAGVISINAMAVIMFQRWAEIPAFDAVWRP